MRRFNGFLLLLIVTLLPVNLAEAAFHIMKIEQIIGGVNGDTSAQAIQLRMIQAGQNVMGSAN